MPKVDTHMHSRHSHDGCEPVRALANAAVEHALAAICITDHCDIEYYDTIDLEKNAVLSFEEAKETNRLFGEKLEVLCGIEIGEALFHPDIAEKMQKLCPFDAILGSIHAARVPNLSVPYSGIDFAKMTDREIVDYMRVYFDDMLEMIERFDPDILTHLTCPLRYIIGKFGRRVDLSLYREPIERILQEIIRRSVALEVNTSSLGSPYDELLPQREIIKRYYALGGRLITLASDAHVAANVAHGFDFAAEELKKIGFVSAYYYKNRQAVPYTL